MTTRDQSIVIWMTTLGSESLKWGSSTDRQQFFGSAGPAYSALLSKGRTGNPVAAARTEGSHPTEGAAGLASRRAFSFTPGTRDDTLGNMIAKLSGTG